MTDAGTDILNDFCRYLAMSVPLFHARHMPDAELDSARRTLDRFVQAGWFCRYALLDTRDRYYTRSAAMARKLLGINCRADKELSVHALIEALGILSLMEHVQADILTPKEFAEQFPDLSQRGLQDNCYFLDHEDRLAWAIIDHGSDPRSLARKVNKAIAKRYRVPGFRPWLTAQMFAITVAVPSATKATAVEKALEEHRSHRLPISVQVVPELQRLLIAKE